MATARRTLTSAVGAPVEIVVDEWGIPHIFAGSAVDAFAAQGYVGARMRLFQLDLWRRRGLGLLAEVLGPEYVELDAAARTFLARNDSDEEYECFGPGARERIEAFVAGVNAYIEEADSAPELLPLEFRALGFRPSPWTVDELLSIRTHGLSANAEEEVSRAMTLRDFGVRVERLRRPLEPEIDLVVPDGLDLAVIDESILDVYRKARQPFTFAAASGIEIPASSPLDGSNNWAVSGARTASGRPILASDPHRIMTFPSLRTLVHLSCPEFDIIGMNEPYMPGVTCGHNGSVAFGVTIAPSDLEDIYVYELHETDDDLYRYDGGWERMTSIVESIPVRGLPNAEITLRFTRHGPVLKVDAAAHTAFALRAGWLEPGMSPYLASLALLESTTVADYVERLDRWGNPALNQVVADADGGIAWQVVGRVPVRPNWDGLLPVPGDGRYEWDGYRTAADLPGIADPESGWVRSANHFNLAEDPDWDGVGFSYEWYSGFRARRLAAALPESDTWDIDSTAALQNDYLAESARDVMAHFGGAFADTDAEFARAELAGWDWRMTPDSRAAVIFDRWLYRHLPRAIRAEAARRAAPDNTDAAIDVLLDARRATIGDPRTDIRLLAEAAEWELSGTFTSVPELVEDTLAATVAELRAELGDESDWSWGAVHVSDLRHAMDGVPGVDESLTRTGRHPKGGSSDTVGVSFGADGVQTLGAGTRIVVDVGHWDESICINSPGQDGALESEHARDLFPAWLADGYVPMLYTRPRIDEHTASVSVLLPITEEGDR